MDKATRPKEELRTIRIGKDVWARLKRRALDEEVTLREVVERAAHQYLSAGPALEQARAASEVGRRAVADDPAWCLECRLGKGQPCAKHGGQPKSKHWDDDMPPA